MTQNGDENPKIQLGETFYGHIRFQHYHIYQKLRERKRSMQPVDILGGLLSLLNNGQNHLKLRTSFVSTLAFIIDQACLVQSFDRP